MNLSSCFLNPLYVWHLSKKSSIAVPHIRTSLSAFTLPCAYFTWCPPALALEDSLISTHLLHATCFTHLRHIPPAVFPFLGWKVLVYLTGSSVEAFFSLWLSFLPFSVYFSFYCVLFETGGGFKQRQHDVSLLCSLFLCWHSACCLSTCTSEHWDGVYSTILTLGSHSQGVRLSLGPITVGKGLSPICWILYLSLFNFICSSVT